MNVPVRVSIMSSLLIAVGAIVASGQAVISTGPPVAPTTRMVQQFNPATGRYEWVGVPYGATVNPNPYAYPGQGNTLDPMTGLYPYPNPRPPVSPGPYPGYPYVTPNPYPGGSLGTITQPAGGQYPTKQIADWYGRYLRRQVDQTGLNAHMQAYQRGGPESALAGILGSQEYYRMWGNDPRRFVAAALSPAKVQSVTVIDPSAPMAMHSSLWQTTSSTRSGGGSEASSDRRA